MELIFMALLGFLMGGRSPYALTPLHMQPDYSWNMELCDGNGNGMFIGQESAAHWKATSHKNGTSDGATYLFAADGNGGIEVFYGKAAPPDFPVWAVTGGYITDNGPGGGFGYAPSKCAVKTAKGILR